MTFIRREQGDIVLSTGIGIIGLEILAPTRRALLQTCRSKFQKLTISSCSKMATKCVLYSMLYNCGIINISPPFKQLQGLEDAVLRNIQAVAELSDLVRTSFGPNGM